MDPTLTLQIPFILLGRQDHEYPTHPVHTISEVLTMLCPDIPVQLGISGDITADGGEQSSAGWVIRPAPGNSEFGTSTSGSDGLQQWRDGDGQLTVNERAQLNKYVWACPMVFQRFGLPLHANTSDWRDFEHEAQKIFETLLLFQDRSAPVPGVEGDAKWWSLVCGEVCWMNISIIPSKSLDTLPATFNPALVKSILMVAATVERELTMLSMPTALIEFWSLSRFLEYREIRRLEKEKADLWRNLKDKKRLTDKRKATIYQRDKEKWMSGFEEKDMVCQRTKGRKREWWDLIQGLDDDGTEEFLLDMKKFEDGGRRLAVSCGLGPMPSQSDAGHQRPSEASTAVSSIVFQGYKSTLDAEEVIAYAGLIASLIRITTKPDHEALGKTLEQLRDLPRELDAKPLQGFKRLLDILDVRDKTTKFWMDKLAPLYTQSDDVTKLTKEAEVFGSSLKQDPFYPLCNYISSSCANEKAYMPTFIERDQQAGGFHPTAAKKLYALMRNEEDTRKQKKDQKRRIEGWLGQLDNVRSSDAVDAEAMLVHTTGEGRGVRDD